MMGVSIDGQQKWTIHAGNILSFLLKHDGIFYKIRSKLPADVLLSLYFAFSLVYFSWN
jgi:hypothetical protein